jgi:nucleoside-diphosphate-sugar epimerase
MSSCSENRSSTLTKDSALDYADSFHMTLRIGVTGANGFIGTALCAAFVKAEWSVVAFSRRGAPATPGVEVRTFDLRQDIDPAVLSNLDVLVHAAHDSSPNAGAINSRGTRALFAAARRAGVPQRVFMSSMAASTDAASRYGQEKLDCEALLDPAVDLIVRPGLVLGEGGLYGSMCTSLERFGIAPLFDGGRQPVYVIGIDDLCKSVVQMIASGAHGVQVVANETPMSMRDLYLAIGRKVGRRIYFAPLPLGPTIAVVTALERLGVRLPLDSERLRGIRNLRVHQVPQRARQ